MSNKLIIAGMILLLVAAVGIISLVSDAPMLTGFITYVPNSPIEKASSTYILTPTLEIGLNYSMAELEQVVALARNLADSCAMTESATLEACLGQELSSQQSWSYEVTGSVAKFEVESVYALPYYDEATQKIEKKAPVYRFAIDFSS